MLAISAGLNYVLYDRAKQYYLQLNETRLDPLGLDYFGSTVHTADSSAQIRAVFFGDSRAAYWPSPMVDGVEFINIGIGAQTSAQVVQRLDEHLVPLNPDMVIIQVGINDLKTIPLFPNRKDAIIANCENNICQIVERSEAIGATVVLTTIFPAGSVPLTRKPFWSDEVAQAIDEVNSFIKTKKDENVIVFDAFTILADENGMLQKACSYDELHLNTAGYAVLNQEFEKIVDSLKP